MKNFRIVLEKMGGDRSTGTLEPDDTKVVWVKEKQFTGIMKAVRWIKKHHKDLKITLNQIDKIDPYNYRCYSTKEFDNTGLNSPDVCMVYVMVMEFRYTDNDVEYGDKMFYCYGQWLT